MTQQTFAYSSLLACWRAYKLCGIQISYAQFCQELFNGGLAQSLANDVKVLVSMATQSDGVKQAQITIVQPDHFFR